MQIERNLPHFDAYIVVTYLSSIYLYIYSTIKISLDDYWVNNNIYLSIYLSIYYISIYLGRWIAVNPERHRHPHPEGGDRGTGAAGRHRNMPQTTRQLKGKIY